MPTLHGFVLEESATTGTGNFTLSPVTGFNQFHDTAGIGAGNTFWYGIRHTTADAPNNEWEEGIGYMLNTNTLVRQTVQASSNGGALVNFSTGNKIVVIDATSVRQNRELEVIGTPVLNDLAQFNGTDWIPVSPDTLSAFGEIYVSPPQIITPAGSLVLAHGLTKTPILTFVVLQNVTPEYGYSAGERVPANLAQSSAGNNRGTSIVADGTNLNIRFGAGSGGGVPVYNVIDRNTGSTQNITNANWNTVFIAVTDGA